MAKIGVKIQEEKQRYMGDSIMENMGSMNEYDRIGEMNHQLYIMKKNNKSLRSKWRQSRDMLEAVMKTLGDKENNLREALENSITALFRMQIQEDNAPLKKIKLDNMNGEPVWVVSCNHDGRWGIVNSSRETIIFPTIDGVEEEYWFDGNYIFQFKKEIKDYSKILIK